MLFDLNEAQTSLLSPWRGIRGHGPRCGRVGVFGAPRGDRDGAEGSRRGWASTAWLKGPTSAPGEQKEHEGEAHC